MHNVQAPSLIALFIDDRLRSTGLSSYKAINLSSKTELLETPKYCGRVDVCLQKASNLVLAVGASTVQCSRINELRLQTSMLIRPRKAVSPLEARRAKGVWWSSKTSTGFACSQSARTRTSRKVLAGRVVKTRSGRAAGGNSTGIKGFLDPVVDAYIILVLMGRHASQKDRGAGKLDSVQPDSSAGSTTDSRNLASLTFVQIGINHWVISKRTFVDETRIEDGYNCFLPFPHRTGVTLSDRLIWINHQTQ
ncbi:hypothetical protein K449DRAFT_431147 [Hypoxylon sp. EC38]|nr:hypothetical protein K449DRAFT_431147 [Hypoxylon sp. EC38]